jgi:hypothetical protein
MQLLPVVHDELATILRQKKSLSLPSFSLYCVQGMSVDIERSAMSLDKQSQVMRLDITDVTCPLPEQVKLRWGPYKQRQLLKPEGSLEQIQARMAAADQKRQVRTPACRNH